MNFVFANEKGDVFEPVTVELQSGKETIKYINKTELDEKGHTKVLDKLPTPLYVKK